MGMLVRVRMRVSVSVTLQTPSSLSKIEVGRHRLM
jgi:hypothetical protein